MRLWLTLVLLAALTWPTASAQASDHYNWHVGDNTPFHCWIATPIPFDQWPNWAEPPTIFEYEIDLPIPIHVPDTFIEIWIRPGPGIPPWLAAGPVASSKSMTLTLSAPLQEGYQVQYRRVRGQEEVKASGWTQVKPLPQALPKPSLAQAIDEDAAVVRVNTMRPGATVEMMVGGAVVAKARAWASPQVTLKLPPNLDAGTDYVLRSRTATMVSPVLPGTIATGIYMPTFKKPRIIEPVADEDTLVWVSNVTPGSRIEIYDTSTGDVLGTKDADESLISVPVCPIDGQIKAREYRGVFYGLSDAVNSVVGPKEDGGLNVTDSCFHYGDYDLSTLGSTDYTDLPIEGQLYRPKSNQGADAPMVILIHGAPAGGSCSLGAGTGGDESYLGYEYLAEHLASWGMYVWSLKVPDAYWMYPDDRGRVAFALMERIAELDDDANCLFSGQLVDQFDTSPIGLVGQSLGGEAVIETHVLNNSEGLPFDIAALVAIAPTTHSNANGLGAYKSLVPYLGIFGSDDYFFNFGTYQFRSVHHYDRAFRDKSQIFAYGAMHEGFNTCWAGSPYTMYSYDGVQLTGEQHERIALRSITPFFVAKLMGDDLYMGYLQGLVKPRGLYGFDLYHQYADYDGPTGSGDAEVIDSMGDS